MREVPVADGTAWHGPDGGRWTWTWRLPLPLTTVDEATLDAQGRLTRWRGRLDGADVEVRFEEGEARWRRDEAAGAFPAVPPLHLLAGGPAWTAWAVGETRPLWVEGEVVDATRLPGEDWQLQAGRRHWRVALDADTHPVEVTWPDGSRLAPGRLDGGLVDPDALLRLAAPAIPDPRRLRRLEVRWPEDEASTVLEAPPLAAVPRLPADAQATPAPPRIPPPMPTLHDDLGPARDRVDLLRRAIPLARRTAAGAAPAAPTQALPGCLDAARALVALLAGRGVEAEVVEGWLLVDAPQPAWVRHAWVRVAFGGPVPWLATDPALGQLVADAGHLPDEGDRRLGPDTAPLVLAAVAADGTVLTPGR
ncbi:MAG: hypothetical protein H6732_03305 [Alphaproteobacteria bacterium]|nr:hypothetical protein [Alphaproteobacteria bacterium]